MAQEGQLYCHELKGIFSVSSDNYFFCIKATSGGFGQSEWGQWAVYYTSLKFYTLIL